MKGLMILYVHNRRGGKGMHGGLLSASRALRSPSARFFSIRSTDGNPPTSSDFVLSTYDKAFKEFLHDTEARNSLFRGFVDGTIQSSEILGLSNKSLKDKDQVTMDSLIAFLSKYKPIMDEYLAIHPVTKSKKVPELSVNTLMHDLATRYYETLCSLLSLAEKVSYMDFRCSLKDGSTVLVKMQARSEPYWNSRALANAARIYSSQLARGESWGEVEKVYALHILGGYDLSREEDVRETWKEKYAVDNRDGTPSVLKRYQFVNIHDSEDKIPDLEFIQIFPQQYLNDSTKLKELGLDDDQVSLASEWLELFKAAQMKSKLYVDRVKDQGVRRAYSILGEKGLADKYKEWVTTYGPVYADNIVQEAVAAERTGERTARLEIARAMKKGGEMTDAKIAAYVDLTEAEVSSIN